MNRTIQNVCLFVFYVNHCSLTFSDIITLLTSNSVVHLLQFLPGVIQPDKVNCLIIFLKGAINCALNILDGLKAIEQPDGPWTTARRCKSSSLLYVFFIILETSMTHLLASSQKTLTLPYLQLMDYYLRWLEYVAGFVTAEKQLFFNVCVWYETTGCWLTMK